MSYAVNIVLTNETEGHTFSEFTEDLERDFYKPMLTEDGEPDFGAIFREMQSEYGRCRSSVYVDVKGQAEPRRVGWFFESRQRYEDTREPYLRGAWVTVVEQFERPRDRLVEIGSR